MSSETQTTDETGTLGQRLHEALGRLLELSKQCAVESKNTDAEYQKAREEADVALHDAKAAVEREYREKTEHIRKQFGQREKRVEQAFEGERRKIEQKYDDERERLDDQADKSNLDANDTLNHNVWLVESVFEGNANKLRDQFELLRKNVDERADSVAQIKQQAADLIKRYRLAPILEEEVAAPVDDVQLSDIPDDVLEHQNQLAAVQLNTLRNCGAAKAVSGVRPFITAIVVLALVVGVTWLAAGLEFRVLWLLASITGSIGIMALVAMVMRGSGRKQVRAAWSPIVHAVTRAQQAAEKKIGLAEEALDLEVSQLMAKRDRDVERTKQRMEPMMEKIVGAKETRHSKFQADHDKRLAKVEQKRQTELAAIEEEKKTQLATFETAREKGLADAQAQYEKRIEDYDFQHGSQRGRLRREWRECVIHGRGVVNEITAENDRMFAPWNEELWEHWTPASNPGSMIRFGELHLDVNEIADGIVKNTDVGQPVDMPVPAMLQYPETGSLLLISEREGRDQAIETLQAVMSRLLTMLPPGRVRFTILDPVGRGQSFAGFMHLADYEESLVTSRIWTESEHIEKRLANLTEHMETVIQKYLRDEFETIDQYNAQAGELAEPYRFLVIGDFPVNFSEESARRLTSIVSSGPRCGVYTLISVDARKKMPHGIDLADLGANGVTLIRDGESFQWQDDVMSRFPLKLDAPPNPEILQTVLRSVGENATDLMRVEVPFNSICPSENEMWSQSTASEVKVPVGRSGATRLQHLSLGKGVAQHALVAGKTGSGKSTLLHVMITNMAQWYGVDEIEFYLIDFKKGVEFKTYATHDLPHVKAVAIESDREFGLSVLQKLYQEMRDRGNMYRDMGVQDVAAYRQASGKRMPRILLLIDEFQEFFSEDDKLAQDATLVLDRLVRQGRAFGIHVLLGSQTLGGAYGLARTTMGQMAVRIALQCTETDSQLILADDNTAARLLSRPGEAIYNDAGGLVEGNSPFQVSWLSDDEHERTLKAIHQKAEQSGFRRSEPIIVFEGNAPSNVSKNPRLNELLEQNEWPQTPSAPRAWIGDPIAIKDPTAAVFRRQHGANMLIVGQRDEAALSMMTASLMGLAAQHRPGDATFYILDGTASDSQLAGTLEKAASMIPHETNLVGWREVPDAMNQINSEMQRRLESHETSAPAIFVLVCGLQRYRMLAKQEEDFSFSSSNEEKPPSPDKQFIDLLRDGPPMGIHSLIWCDAPAALNRSIDRQILREFDARVLFQMSAGDSSNLIDTPIASKLGLHRALFYSEEKGVLEKFRGYSLAEDWWLQHCRDRFAFRPL